MFRSSFYEVKVEHQVQRRNGDYEQAKANPEKPIAVYEADRRAKEAHDKADEIQDRDASGRGHDHQAKVFSRLDPATLIGEQQHSEGAEGQTDGLDDDARVLRFEDSRDSTEDQAL